MRPAYPFHGNPLQVILQDNDIHIWLEPDTGKPTEDFLRDVLGRYLECPAQQLRFARTANGKPYLLDQPLPPLQFNLSHSQGRIACAVSMCLGLGLDIENTQRSIDMDEIAQRFFHPQEVLALQAIADAAQRRQLFFSLWTCKEAYIKAIGQTIASVSLPKIGFDCAADNISALFELPAHQQWCFYTEIWQETVIAVAQARQSGCAGKPHVSVFSS